MTSHPNALAIVVKAKEIIPAPINNAFLGNSSCIKKSELSDKYSYPFTKKEFKSMIIEKNKTIKQ
ncbi:hypothetical protein [Vagococcus sp. CY52-2]|uniref:hypothetical protein n=1 Tax=Vagococcus sp. CY52-2 TaxID=2925838 RepID=UPI001F56D78B|nr:hypothetical protein [Vagococcus sp. CY52-2]MCI0129807.1 hypothetical protein [Vagococcus sp. CY53-2]UNM90444.1 hypothetical protein MN187_04995 [Vagococcus sp. CY52-2]